MEQEVPLTLSRLRTLERQYNGPVPRAALDAVLHETPASLRAARTQTRFQRNRAVQAAQTSAQWRKTETRGGFPGFSPLQRQALRLSYCHEMLLATHEYLYWLAQQSVLDSTKK